MTDPGAALDSLAVDEWAEIEKLSRLDLVEYDRQRKDAADAMGIRPATLDKAVREMRDQSRPEAMEFEAVEPWPEPVDGCELLDTLQATVKKHCIVQEHAAEAVALWITFTWLLDSAYTAPILGITSPEKRCGKTTLLSLLRLLVCRPMEAGNISPPAVFRAVEKWRPCLLIDEADTFIRKSDELRGILNCGHTRTSAFVIRTVEVAGQHEVRRFSTWGAKAIAKIGKLPDTLADRSIHISMRRKLPGERVEKLRHDPYGELRRKLQRFANDHAKAIKDARPEIPEQLNDRASDNWECLFAIADLAGWTHKARAAALALSGEEETDSIRAMLLHDMRRLLSNAEYLSSSDLAGKLAEMEDRPWPEFGRTGKPITPAKIARLLADFNVGPKKLPAESGYGAGTRGYWTGLLAEVFSCYLPPESAKVPIVNNGGLSGENQSATEPARVALLKTRQANNGGTLGTLALSTPPTGEKTENGKVQCLDCANFTPNPNNPGAGIGQCKVEAEQPSPYFARAPRRCDEFRVKDE